MIKSNEIVLIMDHQEILPKRNRADTIAEVADEALGNSQNERLPDVNYGKRHYLTFLYSQMMIAVTKIWKWIAMKTTTTSGRIRK